MAADDDGPDLIDLPFQVAQDLADKLEGIGVPLPV